MYELDFVKLDYITSSMEKIKELLNQISKIVVLEKTQQEERRKRGENFNIFKVLGLSASEVRLHSAFLAELLNPNGDHGLGDKFLLLFLDDVVRKIEGFDLFIFDPTTAKVYIEYDIGQITSDGTEGGRIDILLEDKNHQTIIIENKIYAGDQPLQMLRYYNYATNKKRLRNTKDKKQFCLLYLKRFRSQPSEESTGKSNDVKTECKSICYEKEILGWLGHCFGVAALLPAIRETISQYILNLKILLNIMSDYSENELMKTLLDSKNVEATLRIISEKDRIKESIRNTFLHGLNDRLKKTLEECKMEIDLCEVDRVLKLTTDCPRIYFRSLYHKKSAFAIEISGKRALYGIRLEVDNTNKILMDVYNYAQKPNYGWPYGYSFFEEKIQNWDDTNALLDMALGNVIIGTIEKELKRMIDLDMLSELEARI